MPCNHINKCHALEIQVMQLTIKTFLEAGFALSVFDGEEYPVFGSTDAEKIFEAMYSTYQDYLMVHKIVDRNVTDQEGQAFGRLFFVYGNDGWDVINDHTVNLEPWMAPIENLIDQLQEQ